MAGSSLVVGQILRQDQTRSSEGRRIPDGWNRDLTHAVRSLLRTPTFSAVAALTLALAIGANTAISSVVKTVLLDPLSFPEPDELVVIRGTAPGTDMPEEFRLGPEFYLEYREDARGLEDLAFVFAGQTSVRSGELVERLFVSFWTAAAVHDPRSDAGGRTAADHGGRGGPGRRHQSLVVE